jgi:hypothetical protein
LSYPLSETTVYFQSDLFHDAIYQIVKVFM